MTERITRSQNNEPAAMLLYETNPVGVELFSHVNTFFCSNEFACLLDTRKWVHTPCGVYMFVSMEVRLPDRGIPLRHLAFLHSEHVLISGRVLSSSVKAEAL